VAQLKGKCVVDTNVFLKLFFKEEDSYRAILLFEWVESGAIEIFIPDLVAFEFINILWVKLRQGETDRKECQEILAEFLDLVDKLEVATAALLADRILDASIRYSHPAYDMAFLVLADSLNAPLVTADASLCRKLSAHSRTPILLRDVG
jgi:predicted nucleic acid-binding protein